jgi:hypothetical protein
MTVTVVVEIVAALQLGYHLTDTGRPARRFTVTYSCVADAHVEKDRVGFEAFLLITLFAGTTLVGLDVAVTAEVQLGIRIVAIGPEHATLSVTITVFVHAVIVFGIVEGVAAITSPHAQRHQSHQTKKKPLSE